MKRRDFLRAGLVGPAAAAVASGPGSNLQAAEKRAPVGKVDPDKLATEAIKHFLPGKRTCGEAIVMAGCDALGIKSDLVPDIALGLAGGVGLQGKTCGCVTASAMVLGLAVAAGESDYKKKKMRTLRAVGQLYKRFEKRFGTTGCRKISGLDLTTPEGRKRLETVVKEAKCSQVVEAAARMLAEAIQTV